MRAVLAQPGRGYMGNLARNEVTELERMLRERERVLREEITAALLRSEEEHHKDLAGMVSDAGDESVADMLTDIEIAAVGRDVGELRDALSRLPDAARARLGAAYNVALSRNPPGRHATGELPCGPCSWSGRERRWNWSPGSAAARGRARSCCA
jgi:hypothetical protein